MAGNAWKWLEMGDICWNGWKLKEMAGNVLTRLEWLDIDGKGWNGLKWPAICQKWLEIGWPYDSFGDQGIFGLEDWGLGD